MIKARPSQNPDHVITWEDPNDLSTWKVLKGRKTIREIYLDEINASSATAAVKTRVKTRYRL